MYRYQAKPADNEELHQQLRDLAARKPRWGFPKMVAYFRNRGFRWNSKPVRRVYREMGHNLRVKPKKRLPVRDPHSLWECPKPPFSPDP